MADTKEPIATTFARKVLFARRSAVPLISQQRLADLTGVDQMTISRLENDDRHGIRWETVARLAGALGISLDEIIREAGYYEQYAMDTETLDKVTTPGDT